MRIIAKRTLFSMADQHGDCTTQVNWWYRIAKKATWGNLNDIQEAFRHADSVGDKTVFNIKGNDYRLIVYIDYAHGTIYIKGLLTHAEYNKGPWKDK